MPIQYRQVLLGTATTLDELSGYQPQEEGTPEGSLLMLEISLASAPSSATIDGLNTELASAGVIPWPGNTQVSYLSPDGLTLTLMWVKALAWIPIIIGMLALTILPPIIGMVLWWLIPEEVKQMIYMVVMMGVMFLMMSFIMPMFSSGSSSERKQVKGGE